MAILQSLEERVACLEGKVEEHSRGFGKLREAIRHLDQKVDRIREELAARIGQVDLGIDALDQKVSRHFMWLVGIQIAVLLAVIGALLRA